MMHLFLTPGTRRLIRITQESAEEMEKWFNLFMGNEVAPRKEYIEEHFDEVDRLMLDVQ